MSRAFASGGGVVTFVGNAIGGTICVREQRWRSSIANRGCGDLGGLFKRLRLTMPGVRSGGSSSLRLDRVIARAVLETKPVNTSRQSQLEVATEDSRFELARERLQQVLSYAEQLPRLPHSERIDSNRVIGCTARVWLTVAICKDGLLNLGADSDSEFTRGLCSVIVHHFNGSHAADLLHMSADAVSGLASELVADSRSHTLYNVFVSMQKRIRMHLTAQQGGHGFNPFPSLLISADGINAQGDFARAQAMYLVPDPVKVQQLADLLREKQIGVVAHFYMDPEVQGVLVAVQKLWPHVHISDSLVMADKAVKMVEAGCKNIAVLGVDFMSENVAAILQQAQYLQVGVFRMSSQEIGCSLAEAAQSPGYLEFLKTANNTPNSLHVIYVNTSLETKAQANSLVPTITCTSSNVLQTLLQTFAQVPDATVWYGPDSHMGANLEVMFSQLSNMTDEEIKAMHPLHNRETIAAGLHQLHHFKNGVCYVHDLFGKDVVARLRRDYLDAYMTAHLEVPGDMFALAVEARKHGKGTVGSTQNILDFITARVLEAIDRGFDDHLQFVLGTEAGMVTAIVGAVQQLLKNHRSSQNGEKAKIVVEIVFPVSGDAVAPTSQPERDVHGLAIVPGVGSGEGCSMSGGCASCSYMKMNTLDALVRVCKLVGTAGESLLASYEPKKFGRLPSGESVADFGCKPILRMRHFQSTGHLSDELVHDIRTRDRIC